MKLLSKALIGVGAAAAVGAAVVVVPAGASDGKTVLSFCNRLDADAASTINVVVVSEDVEVLGAGTIYQQYRYPTGEEHYYSSTDLKIGECDTGIRVPVGTEYRVTVSSVIQYYVMGAPAAGLNEDRTFWQAGQNTHLDVHGTRQKPSFEFGFGG